MLPYRPGFICCFMGSLGSGKTLDMTYQAAIWHNRGVNTFANYPTVFSQRIMGVRHLVKIENGLLLLDEAQSLLDSRAFSKNVDVTQWLLLIRKMGLGMFYTTQHFSFVDKRLREITDMVIVHRKSFETAQASILDIYGIEGFSGRLYGSVVLRYSPKLFRLYDTYDKDVGLTLDGTCKPFSDDLFEQTAPARREAPGRKW